MTPALAGLVAFSLAVGLSAEAAFTPTTGVELTNAVAQAKAAWEATSKPQEIILAAGKYETSSEIFLTFPVTVRGATGNPADVTVGKAGMYKLHRKFTLDHADARLLNLTVTGGFLQYDAVKGASMYGAGVRVAKARTYENDWQPANLKGAGGTVSNCIFTANSISYKNDSAIIYVNGPADKTLVTCCVVTNNSVSRQTDSSTGPQSLGSIIHVDSGRFTSSLVCGNRILNSIAATKQDETSVVEARGGSVENCLVNNNRIYDSYDPTVLRVIQRGCIHNTIVAGNNITTSSWSRADWPESSRYWAGNAAGFTNCVVQATNAVLPNATCFVTNLLWMFDYAAGDYRLRRLSPLRATASMKGVLTTGLDLLGNPRLNSSKRLDVGPIAFDPTLVYVEGRCWPGSFYEGETASFLVTVDEGFGDNPRYYWTLVRREDGSVRSYPASGPLFTVPVGTGNYDVKLSVSNLATRTGTTVTLKQGFVSHQRRFYAKPNNPGAAAPYATEATAAGDLQTAINAVTTNGVEVVALPGLYEIVTNVLVRRNQIVLRGSTGRPEDVVVRNTTTSKWMPQDVYDERLSYGEGRCLALDAGPAARVESMTFENGKGLYSVDYGCGLYLGNWVNRGTWPGLGKGGTVSNCVVRNCYAGVKYGAGPGIFANGPYLITHTVISNCTSGAGNVNGGRFVGVGLELGGGARAENCLIRNNTTITWTPSGQQWPEYGRGTVGGVMVRDNSVLRFSTVVGNSGAMVGGVNVNGTEARVENCIILGNRTMGEASACSVTTNRHNCWAMMTWPGTEELISGTTVTGGGNIGMLTASEIAYVDAHPEAVDAAFLRTMTDWAVAGSTGILSSSAETFRDPAKGDYGLRSTSQAVNCVRRDEAGAMPYLDLSGQLRLSGIRYDLGCYELQKRRGLVFLAW